jgi:hypothetical protein
LFRRPRREDCKILADLAKAILDAKKKLHEIVGSIAGWVASKLGADALERTVARELAQKIPIPMVDDMLLSLLVACRSLASCSASAVAIRSTAVRASLTWPSRRLRNTSSRSSSPL